MKKNIGSLDSNIRITLAIVLSLLFLGKFIVGALGLVVFIVGIVLLLTSLINFCPLYSCLVLQQKKRKCNTIYEVKHRYLHRYLYYSFVLIFVDSASLHAYLKGLL
jgi:hypothetical protein